MRIISANIINYYRFVVLNILALFSVCSSFADNAINDKFYKEGLEKIYTATDKGLIISRTIDFPGIYSEDLYEKVLNYFVFRHEHETNYKYRMSFDANGISFHRVNRKNSITIEEATPVVNKLGVPAHWCEYLFRIEVKNEKIRATFFLNNFEYDGAYLFALDAFPYKNVHTGTACKCLKEWGNYFTDVLDSLKEDVMNRNELDELKSDW